MKVYDKELVDDQIRHLNREGIVIWNDNLEEGFTVNFVLNRPDWKKEYEKLTHEFRESGDALYVYPFERLHMTLLGRIDKELGKEKISEVVKKNMVGKKFIFDIGYLACNNNGVSIIAEPRFDLAGLRTELRKGLGIKGDDYTKYLSIYESLAWMNFIRFKDKPGDKFFETLWQMRNYQFGEHEAKSIGIFFNSSRTMDPHKSRLVEEVIF